MSSFAIANVQAQLSLLIITVSKLLICQLIVGLLFCVTSLYTKFTHLSYYQGLIQLSCIMDVWLAIQIKRPISPLCLLQS